MFLLGILLVPSRGQEVLDVAKAITSAATNRAACEWTGARLKLHRAVSL